MLGKGEAHPRFGLIFFMAMFVGMLKFLEEMDDNTCEKTWSKESGPGGRRTVSWMALNNAGA
jgi:hypothetical protein